MKLMLRIIVALTSSLAGPISILLLLNFIFPENWSNFNTVGLLLLILLLSPVTFIASYAMSRKLI